MRALLIQHGCEAAVLPADMEAEAVSQNAMGAGTGWVTSGSDKNQRISPKFPFRVIKMSSRGLFFIWRQRDKGIIDEYLRLVWHKRLGHINEAGLQVLEKQGLFGKESLGEYGFIFLGSNIEAFGKFKEWKQFSKNLDASIESEIARHLTVAGMPQQKWGSRKFESPSTSDRKRLLGRCGRDNPSDLWDVGVFGCVAYPHKINKIISSWLGIESEGQNETFDVFRDESNMDLLFTGCDGFSVESSREKKIGRELWINPLAKAGELQMACHVKDGIKVVQKPSYKEEVVAPWIHTEGQLLFTMRFLGSSTSSIRVILALTACKDYELTAYDMLIACKSKAEIGSTKSLLKKEFDMKEPGEAKKILSMEIIRDRSLKILRVSQPGYVSNILNNFRIDNGKSLKMPLGGYFKLSLKDCGLRNVILKDEKGAVAKCGLELMYLMDCTRPDIRLAHFEEYYVAPKKMESRGCYQREELAGSMDSIYEYIDPTPLASALIAKVHAARLKGSHTDVVIKVLKAGIEDVLVADLNFIYVVARIAEFINPELSRASRNCLQVWLTSSLIADGLAAAVGQVLDKWGLWWVADGVYGRFLMSVSDGFSFMAVSDGFFFMAVSDGCGIVWLIGVADAVFLIRVPDDVLLSDAGLLMPFADKRVDVEELLLNSYS
ncbi:retrovirus-related pol polyprotein from transposon TNT 1-94 [Tanacetum coccineum]